MRLNLRKEPKYAIIEEIEVIKMLSDKQLEDIEKELHKKGFDTRTKEYIIEYIKLNENLFGEFININSLINRVVKNLNHNISVIKPKGMSVSEVLGIFTKKGNWNPYENRISISPGSQVLSLISKHQKVRMNSTIRHELDHCATTDYVKVEENEQEMYIQDFFELNNIVDDKEKVNFRTFVNNLYKKYNNVLAVCGIKDNRQELRNDIYLSKLNEGITAYKQELYDNYLGNKTSSNYKAEKNVAKFIAETIGKEKLINMHFNHDYESIRKNFNSKTGTDLNDLVGTLNNNKSWINKYWITSIMFGKQYDNKKIENHIQQIKEMTREKNSRKRNIDFIPKVDVDYTEIGKNIQNVSQKEYQRDR